MSTDRRASRLPVAAAVLVLAGVIVGSVVAGRMVWLDDAASLNRALAETKPVKLTEIAAADGKTARGVFAQITSMGYVCISDAPLDAPLSGGGGCNRADDPLGGRAINASLSFDGGPATEDVADARVVGLAAADVASVRILMSDASFRSVKLAKAKVGMSDLAAFGYRFRKSDLKKGIGPVAIVAFDKSGTEIDRQTTGIG